MPYPVRSVLILGVWLLSSCEAAAINTRAQRYSAPSSVDSGSGADAPPSSIAKADPSAPAGASGSAVAAKLPQPPAPKQYDLTLTDGRKLRLKGVDVKLIGADGSETQAPDATYIATDGKVIPAKGGKIQGLR